MWGSDYPHDEGTVPVHARAPAPAVPRHGSRRAPAAARGHGAQLYGFDLDALAPLAQEFGPTVAEIAQPLTELPEKPNEALLKGRTRRAS